MTIKSGGLDINESSGRLDLLFGSDHEGEAMNDERVVQSTPINTDTSGFNPKNFESASLSTIFPNSQAANGVIAQQREADLVRRPRIAVDEINQQDRMHVGMKDKKALASDRPNVGPTDDRQFAAPLPPAKRKKPAGKPKKVVSTEPGMISDNNNNRPGTAAGKNLAGKNLAGKQLAGKKKAGNKGEMSYYQTVTDDTCVYDSGPFVGWHLYFPNEPYNENNRELLDVIDGATDKYMRHGNLLIDFDQIKRSNSQLIDLDAEDVHTGERVFPAAGFMDLLENEPGLVVSCYGLALHQLAIRFGNSTAPPAITQRLAVRFVNYPRRTKFSEIKSGKIGKFVGLRGTVVRLGMIKPLITQMAFTCNLCKKSQSLFFTDGIFKRPVRCASTSCINHTVQPATATAASSQFIPERNSSDTKSIDSQIVRIQELVEDDDVGEDGRIPRHIDCELTVDLVDSCVPGMVVALAGEVKVLSSVGTSRTKKGAAVIFQTYVHVNALFVQGEAEGKGENSTSFDVTDLYAIRDIRNSTKVFRRLVNSIAPSICGHEIVKAGLALCLFGADQRHSDDKNRVPVRGDSHVLIVGDPGLGKSQLLRAVSEIAPRSVYVSGNASTTAGLTVSITRDASAGDGSGDYSLEAGALVLADKGVCCIDEFDKMGRSTGSSTGASTGASTATASTYQALLEAMEQQVISVAKAGIVCSLPCRASIVAAGNPVGGHYDRSKSISDNLRLSPALLSRFDLVFILLDDPNEQLDMLLSEHVMAIYMGKKKTENLATPYYYYNTSNSANSNSTNSNDYMSSSLNGSRNVSMLAGDECCQGVRQQALGVYLRLPAGEMFTPLTTQMFRKYVAYARRYVHPRLSEEAAVVIKEFYLGLREHHYVTDTTPITTRQLESMIRLCEARARAELREIVSEADAFDVIEIVKASLIQVSAGADGENTNPAAMGPAAGHSSGKRGLPKKTNSAKQLMGALHKTASERLNTLFTHQEIRGIAATTGLLCDINELIDKLNLAGMLLKKGGSLYQLNSPANT